MLERLTGLESEFADVEARLADPAVLADQARYTELARRHKELEAIVSRARELRTRTDDLEAAKQMLSDSSGGDREFARAEVDSATADIERLDDELKLLLLPKDQNDDRNVIVEIRGAEGGEEANLFARDLFQMYQGFAQRMGWKLEVLGSDLSAMGGYNEITFLLSGDGVWTRMKHEAGPHRVQRVPVTESQGRIHTSSATVTVLPEAEEVDVGIDERDLQVDVYRSSGPGGQSVNTTDSTVRVTHKPTGLVVAMQDEKSQIQNRAKAMRVLRARLLRLEQDRQDAEASEARRGQIGGGGRSEKIRTYNYKDNRVTDHRIRLTIYRLDRVLAGELDEISDALVHDEQARAGSPNQLSDGITWRGLLDEAVDRLDDRGEARRIVEEACGREGAELTPHLDTVPDALHLARYRQMVERRASGEPLQYVLGRWGFRTLDVHVDRRVLIPRPETEVVVDHTLRAVDDLSATTVVDLGTGSGVIAMSLAAERTTLSVWASDVSPDALAVATANLAGLGRAASRVRLVEGEWFDALPAELRGAIGVVVSNPPYVAEDDQLPPEVSDWEPRDALIAGPTGLEAIEHIVRAAPTWLRRPGALVLEVGETQGESVRRLATDAGFTSVDVESDLTGRSRVLVARRAQAPSV